MVSGRLGTVLVRGAGVSRAAALSWPRRLWPVASASDATAARTSLVPGRLAGCAVSYRTRPTAIGDPDLPNDPAGPDTRYLVHAGDRCYASGCNRPFEARENVAYT